MTHPGWRLRTRILALDEVAVMGVVNVTPDSFSDGGRFVDSGAAVEHGRALVAAGADLVDVGGESTRPGAEPVDAGTELARVVPVVRGLAADGIVVSVDTSKPEVAEAALAAGAEAVNDVTGMGNPELRRVCAEAGAGVVVMHMQGSPRTMQANPTYGDVVAEVRAFLADRARLAIEAGVDPEAVCLDPGIGFGKTIAHNLALLRGLEAITELGHPVAVGTSRKRFLGEITGITDPAQRDLASAVSVALAVERGARVVRVHEPGGARQAVRLALAIVRAGP